MLITDPGAGEAVTQLRGCGMAGVSSSGNKMQGAADDSESHEAVLQHESLSASPATDLPGTCPADFVAGVGGNQAADAGVAPGCEAINVDGAAFRKLRILARLDDGTLGSESEDGGE
jgi:hypothetical protein